MSSKDVFKAWEEKYADLVQRLDLGPREVASKLALGEQNLQRARRALDARDPDEVVVYAEAVIVNAADAVLARDGLRLRGKTGSHEARAAYPGLPAEFTQELRVIGTMRRARNTALYDEVGRVSEDQARDSLRVAELLLAAAGRATE